MLAHVGPYSHSWLGVSNLCLARAHEEAGISGEWQPPLGTALPPLPCRNITAPLSHRDVVKPRQGKLPKLATRQMLGCCMPFMDTMAWTPPPYSNSIWARTQDEPTTGHYPVLPKGVRLLVQSRIVFIPTPCSRVEENYDVAWLILALQNSRKQSGWAGMQTLRLSRTVRR